MSINKNFVVKNGFEVNTDLVLANATTKRVGIATTQPGYTLDVAGGIGVTNLYVSGISTFRNEFYVRNGSNTTLSALGVGGSVGVGTALPAYLLDVRSPVSTGQTALYVQGDVRLTGDLLVDDITIDLGNFNNLTIDDTLYVTGITTLRNDLNVGGATTTAHLRVIGVSTIGSLFASGITTITNDVNIAGVTTTQHLRVTGVSTVASLFASGITTITNDVNIAGVTTTQHLRVTGVTTTDGINASGITTITNNVNIAGVTTTQHLLVTGISTIGTGVTITSGGNINAVSGVVTATRFVGSGSSLTGNARNLTATIGIGSTGGVVGYGVTFINFYGPGVSTAYYSSTTGIATVYFQGGGGGGASVSIGTVAPVSPTSGDLWYNNEIGRTFIYYDEVYLGIGNAQVWVDTSPFNIGVLNPVSIALSTGTFSSPSLYFSSDSDTGLFQPTPNQQTFVAAGASVLNVNPGGINVTGVVTATSFRGDGSNLTNLPAGLGTALSSDQTSPLNKIYYTDQVLSIGSTVTVDPPSTAKVAYTQYAEIQVDGDADLIIADGDEFIPNILGIGTTGTVGTIGGGGRVRADNFSNRSGTGAPTFNAGLNVTGVVTATSAVINGTVTATSFVGSGANLTNLNIPAGFDWRDASLF